MPKPERLSALIAEKKPPTLQPKASIAPTPISKPPPAPLTSSPRGGTRIANSRAEQRGREPAEQHAEVQQRAGVEPGRDEIGSMDEAQAPEDPVAPVAQAVGGGPRAIEGEEEDVDGGDQDGGAPHGPGTPEDRGVLRGERRPHQRRVNARAAR